ncbi:cyclin-I-like [Watersipora subatra]|uniref:cyclin-I-like n=1 Tax=Watersipora subatra TaxID=2589382 RepID=UPI00355BFBCF
MKMPVSNEHMVKMLEDAIIKEKAHWKALDLTEPTCKGGAGVGYEHRSDIVEWLSLVAHKFQFYPEALSLAVSVLDKFLTCMKVQTKYLKCVALACLYIACKITEEDEVVPHIADLVTQSSAYCRADDIVRMERLILNKLAWDVNLATSLHFLQVSHALLLAENFGLLSTVKNITPTIQLNFLTQKLQLCMTSREFCQWSPSLIAVSLISLELEQFRPDWLPLTLSLLKRLKKFSFSELISCREGLSAHLMHLVEQAQEDRRENYSRQHKRTRHHTNMRSKRKMTELPLDQDDIYSSIKNLYSEGGIGGESCTKLEHEE